MLISHAYFLTENHDIMKKNEREEKYVDVPLAEIFCTKTLTKERMQEFSRKLSRQSTMSEYFFLYRDLDRDLVRDLGPRNTPAT